MSRVLLAGAGLLGLLLAARPLELVEGGAREGTLVVAALAVALLAGALWRPGGVLGPLAGAALVGEYALALVAGDRGLDPLAPLVGLGLFALLELLEAGAEARRAELRIERRLVLRRVRWTALVGAGGLLAALLVLSASTSADAGDDAGVRALAMAGAAAALAIPVLLARRTLRRPKGELHEG